MDDAVEPNAIAPAVVFIGLDKDDVPFSRPKSCEAWVRPNNPDSVRFVSRYEFTVEFPDDSPFAETKFTLEENQKTGLFEKELPLREDALACRYKYDLRYQQYYVDPDIVVKKDPTRR